MMIAINSSGPSASYRYWRLLVTATADASWYAAQELELRGAHGGANLTSPALSAASAIAFSSYSANEAKAAFDGNLTNLVSGAWVGPKVAGQYIGWDFGIPTVVTEVAYLPQARADLVARAPTAFKVQGSSDKISWIDVSPAFSGVSGWALGTWKVFSW